MNSRLIVTLSLYLIINTFFILIISSSSFKHKSPQINDIKGNLWENMNSIDEIRDYIKSLHSKGDAISFLINNFDGGTEIYFQNDDFFITKDRKGETERKTGVYKDAHEDLSTLSTHNLPAEVEFRKGSNEVISIRDKYANLIISILDAIKTKYKGFSFNIKLPSEKNLEKKIYPLEALLQKYKNHITISISTLEYHDNNIHIIIERE